MMKIFSYILIAFIGLSLPAWAQSSGLDRYFEEFQDDERFTQITVSSKMFNLFVNFEMDDPDEQELVEAISKLKGLKSLVGLEVNEAAELYKQVVERPAGEMDELMSVKDGSGQFRFFITETAGTVSELLMIGYDTSKIFMISLVGDMNLRQIAALSQKMNINGFEHFKNIDKDE